MTLKKMTIGALAMLLGIAVLVVRSKDTKTTGHLYEVEYSQAGQPMVEFTDSIYLQTERCVYFRNVLFDTRTSVCSFDIRITKIK